MTESVDGLDADICIKVTLVGDDLLGLLTGPNPHLGAISMGEPYTRDDANLNSACVSTISRYMHRDGEITRRAAQRLAKALNRVVVVTGGLHVERLSSKGLLAIYDALDRLIERCASEMKSVLQ
ncbi:MAG: hypothetical protein ACTSVM_04250 [Candidatus Ranarchaeia archaeon]